MKRNLTLVQRKEILTVLKIGSSRDAAARFAKSDPATLRRYIREHPKFAQEVAKAEQDAEVYCLTKLRKATDKDQQWRCAAWMLERRYPNRYGVRKANVLTKEELQALFRNFGDIIGSEIADESTRQRVLQRIEETLGC
ncbi:hypothetical protein FACS1894170_08750 [Planctomycetales bacterium]|nr:hypothetical protein FACS1894170_08750 [Planctomycetales bacterium]